jgi:hypothetical protein
MGDLVHGRGLSPREFFAKILPTILFVSPQYQIMLSSKEIIRRVEQQMRPERVLDLKLVKPRMELLIILPPVLVHHHNLLLHMELQIFSLGFFSYEFPIYPCQVLLQFLRFTVVPLQPHIIHLFFICTESYFYKKNTGCHQYSYTGLPPSQPSFFCCCEAA